MLLDIKIHMYNDFEEKPHYSQLRNFVVLFDFVLNKNTRPVFLQGHLNVLQPFDGTIENP